MSNTSEEPAEVEYVQIIDSRPAAVLIRTYDRDVWLPWSQVIEHDEERKTFTIPEWLAIKKDLV